ncbi:MAG TPA: AIR synthase-related protein, partial [Gemmatimonadaceae bacterium]|nr:AIR synthase-related protein [Gemmatimonadaceae bacterium]
GLTSSSAEMAARGDVGVTIDVTKVPVRERGMTPYEILLSESQERMLVVARKGREREVAAILEKWDLTASVIGEVIAEPVYRVSEGDVVVAEFPGTQLVTDCPTYTPDAREDPRIAALRARDVGSIPERPEERDPLWTLEQILTSPTIASKMWVYRQYDHTVRTNTVLGPGGDAAVVRVRNTRRALALKTDCNGRYCYLDPRVGTRIAVAEAARNVACAGGRPMAITNNLNFGNPRRPEVYYQLREATAGMAEACEKLGTPVTGGNVSLYNENPGGAVYPTPVIGMVGLIDEVDRITRANFSNEKDAVVLLGTPTAELGGSEYLARVHDIVAGSPPRCDLDAERDLIEAILAAIEAGIVRSAHDTSDGGLAVALAECCIIDRGRPLGAKIDLSPFAALPPRALLFGEAQGRALLSTPDPTALCEIAARHGVMATVIGEVASADDPLDIRFGDRRLTASLPWLDRLYYETIPNIMTRSAAAVVSAAAESPV